MVVDSQPAVEAADPKDDDNNEAKIPAKLMSDGHERPVSQSSMENLMALHKAIIDRQNAPRAPFSSNVPNTKLACTIDEKPGHGIIGKMCPTSQGLNFRLSDVENPSDVISPSNAISLFEYATPGAAVMPIETELLWVKIPVAVDSGACAHVTPVNCFGGECDQVKGADFFGAEGSPIKNLGKQKVTGVDSNNAPVELKFNMVSKLSRPLMSVFEIAELGHEVHFGKGKGWIESPSGVRTELRCEGKLWFLDIWTQVPKSMASSPFARQS